ncbi:MAG: hypothetical protein ACREUA_10300 [Burkholderiales bacterium]
MLEKYGVADERAYLRRYIDLVQSAIGLVGVDENLRQKVINQLILPAAAVTFSFEVGPNCLVGKQGAIPIYQNMLDLVRPGFDKTYPFATVLGGYFELARYAERSRRRSGEPLLVHSLRVEALLRHKLGAITPTIGRAAIFHDYIEDRIWDCGHPATLVKRTGLAALVTFELSDPLRRGIDDFEKAAKFQNRTLTPKLKWSRELFGDLHELLGEEEYLAKVICPAVSDFPYSIKAALIKLADFVDTMRAGLHYPQRMKKDGWSQSGKRIGVHINKESVVLKLFDRLVEEYQELSEEAGIRVRDLLETYATYSRQYARMNMEIVCEERGISDQNVFIEEIFAPSVNNASIETKWGRYFTTVQPPHTPYYAVSLDKLTQVYRPNIHHLLGMSQTIGSARTMASMSLG